MNAKQEARTLNGLYTELYRHLHRRRDPREPRPSGEALAMLQHLMDSGPLTVSEASRHFDRSQSAISERLDRLVEQGLVERLADGRDHRRHLVWLTPAAEALLAVELQVLDLGRLEQAIAEMSEIDRQALLRGLAALLAATRSISPHQQDDER